MWCAWTHQTKLHFFGEMNLTKFGQKSFLRFIFGLHNFSPSVLDAIKIQTELKLAHPKFDWLDSFYVSKSFQMPLCTYNFFFLFQNYGLLEEKQAKERSPIQDSKNFELTCNQMKEVLAKVYETKQSGRKSTEVLSELKTDFLMHFLTLKKLNRHSEPKFENLIRKLFILLCH